MDFNRQKVGAKNEKTVAHNCCIDDTRKRVPDLVQSKWILDQHESQRMVAYDKNGYLIDCFLNIGLTLDKG